MPRRRAEPDAPAVPWRRRERTGRNAGPTTHARAPRPIPRPADHGTVASLPHPCVAVCLPAAFQRATAKDHGHGMFDTLTIRLEEGIAQIVAFLPRLFMALGILMVGLAIAKMVE